MNAMSRGGFQKTIISVHKIFFLPFNNAKFLTHSRSHFYTEKYAIDRQDYRSDLESNNIFRFSANVLHIALLPNAGYANLSRDVVFGNSIPNANFNCFFSKQENS